MARDPAEVPRDRRPAECRAEAPRDPAEEPRDRRPEFCMSSDQGQELVKTVADQLAINYSPPPMQTNRGQSDGRSRRVGPGQDNVGSGQPGDRRVGSGRPGFRRVWSYGPCQTDGHTGG